MNGRSQCHTPTTSDSQTITGHEGTKSSAHNRTWTCVLRALLHSTQLHSPPPPPMRLHLYVRCPAVHVCARGAASFNAAPLSTAASYAAPSLRPLPCSARVCSGRCFIQRSSTLHRRLLCGSISPSAALQCTCVLGALLPSTQLHSYVLAIHMLARCRRQ